jgi:hypothetical protein
MLRLVAATAPLIATRVRKSRRRSSFGIVECDAFRLGASVRTRYSGKVDRTEHVPTRELPEPVHTNDVTTEVNIYVQGMVLATNYSYNF